jgi:7,8-dihydro-6-hydroxymethylpterin-pyrophosphokinase
LVPLAEVDPAVIHPVLARTASQILEELKEDGEEVTLLQ